LEVGDGEFGAGLKVRRDRVEEGDEGEERVGKGEKRAGKGA
jgi:hypothetical protein